MFICTQIPIHILLQHNLKSLHGTASHRWAKIRLTDLPDGLRSSQICFHDKPCLRSTSACLHDYPLRINS